MAGEPVIVPHLTLLRAPKPHIRTSPPLSECLFALVEKSIVSQFAFKQPFEQKNFAPARPLLGHLRLRDAAASRNRYHS